MSIKNSITTSDYIEYDLATQTAIKLMKSPKTELIARYIIIAINTGLRPIDILNLGYGDLSKQQIDINDHNGVFRKGIAINDAVRAIIPLDTSRGLFTTQKGSTITMQHLNRLLKEAFKNDATRINVSSHSFRKCFGRRVLSNNNYSDISLSFLMNFYNHSSRSITRQYLGIHKEELSDMHFNI